MRTVFSRPGRFTRLVHLGRVLTIVALACAALPAVTPAHAERLKDLVQIQGVRDNPLIGYGLVVGLDGTGDQTTQTPFTTQTLANMLANLGISINNQAAGSSNSAVVAVEYPVEERRRGDGDGRAAAVRASRRSDRRDGIVARQFEEPARRHAAAHAAEGRRRPGVCAWPGQCGGRRRWRERERQQGAGEHTQCGPRRRRRDRRTRGADLGVASGHDAARPERHGLRHHAARGGSGEQRVRQRHGHRRSTAARSNCARRPIRSSRSPSWRNCRTSTSSRRRPPRR